MVKWTEDMNAMPPAAPGPVFPRMLSLEQVQEILNVKSSLVYWCAAASCPRGNLVDGVCGGCGRVT